MSANESDNLRKSSCVRKKKLKQLLDKGGEISERAQDMDIVDTLKQLSRIVKVADDIKDEGQVVDRIESTTEVVMDAQVLKMAHEIMGTAIEKISRTAFDEHEYANIIKSMIRTENGIEDWSKVEEIACSIQYVTGYCQSLYGVIDEEIVRSTTTVVKEKQARTKAQLAQLKKPKTVGQLQNEEKTPGRLNNVMQQINKLYKNNCDQPIPYYQLIIDPTDFMSTVDNAFQVSFLVRDGCLAITKGYDGYPIVRPTTTAELEAASSTTNRETIQAISSLNPLQCQELTQLYDIKEPLLTRNQFEDSDDE